MFLFNFKVGLLTLSYQEGRHTLMPACFPGSPGPLAELYSKLFPPFEEGDCLADRSFDLNDFISIAEFDQNGC